MITQEDVFAIVKEKAEIIKKAKASGKSDKMPEFTPIYHHTVDLYDRVRVHAVDGVFPYNLFKDKAPNEKPEEFEYRKRLYKAIGSITNPYWERAQSKLNRVWNEKNYVLEIKPIDAVEFEDFTPNNYFFKKYPEFGSLEAYFKSIVTVEKINDPNAWLAIDVMPVVRDTEPLKPYARIYNCKDIWGFERGHYLLVKTEEKSLVTWGNIKKKEGIVLRMYTPSGIYRIEQVGRKIDYKFAEPELVHEYNFEELAAWPLKGKPVTDDGQVYYQSYFQPAVATLNSALIDANTLQISKIVNSFPERWEYVDYCDAMGCEGGMVWDDQRINSHYCQSCGGSGKKNWSSPLSVIEVPVPKVDMPTSAKTESIGIPPAGYINKQDATENLRFLREEVIQEIHDAFAMIHIDVSNSNAKGSDTALGKQIDREEQFAFLLQISSELFDLLYYSMEAMGIVRYGDAWQGVDIGYPQNFAIRGDQELTEEISNAKDSGIPDIAIQTLLRQYAGTRFNSQADVERVFDLTFKADRVLTSTPLEINSKVAMGLLSKEAAILHDSINFFIEKAERENADFWDRQDAEKIEILDNYAKQEAAKLTKVRMPIEEGINV